MSIHREERDGTVVLRIDRPPVNALDLDAIEALARAFSALRVAPPAAGAVLTGTGRVFSAGVDIRAAANATRAETAAMVLGINRMAAALYALPCPVVAALPGHAIGGGLVLALACDWRIAAEGAGRFGLTEVSAGIPYPAVPMAIVREAIAEPHRSRLVLGGELIELPQAQAMGLVDETVAPGQLLEQALERTRKLASASAYAQVKQQLRGDLIERLEAIVASARDPLLEAGSAER